jgi:malate synthase
MSLINVGNGFEVPEQIWTPQFQAFFTKEFRTCLAVLLSKFEQRRGQLLASRKKRQIHFNQGKLPEFLDRNSPAVKSDWKVRPIPSDYLKRRVEITGPVNDPKMVINMLSRNEQGHRADTAMLDFEDSMRPIWKNVLAGIQNVYDATRGQLAHHKTDSNGNIVKTYKLDPADMAGLMVRIRGLHLNESNILFHGLPISAGVFDLFSCYFHNANELILQGKTPKFYVPKCEHFLEAQWWNDLFSAIEDIMSHHRGTLRATFLIETLGAAFQIEEILYEIRDHAAGLNVGRWDKIFSDIKTLRYHPNRITPDRTLITMDQYWMDNYAKRLVKICHARGAFAIGGMAAFTPGKDAKTRSEQTAKVIKDKKQEAEIGHDGCWVSHPYFIGPALECFKNDNQLNIQLSDFDRYPNLIMKGSKQCTLEGLRKNIRVGIAYMRGWAQGLGCVAWDNLMEDLATLEISRSQVWQWKYHNIVLTEGLTVNDKLIKRIFSEELDKILLEVAEMYPENQTMIKNVSNQFIYAKETAVKLFTKEHLDEFLETDSPFMGKNRETTVFPEKQASALI